MLDVFHQEPLPVDHAYWSHPAVTVTPHVASQIDAETGGRLIAADLDVFERTGTCQDLADAARGYRARRRPADPARITRARAGPR